MNPIGKRARLLSNFCDKSAEGSILQAFSRAIILASLGRYSKWCREPTFMRSTASPITSTVGIMALVAEAESDAISRRTKVRSPRPRRGV